MKAGFFKPARELGKQVRAKGGVTIESGKSASKSYGEKSISGKMRALAHNAVEGSGDYAEPYMIRAMDETSRTQLEFANRIIKKANAKFAAKTLGRIFK